MADKATITFKDVRNKATAITINTTELTAANFEGVLADVATLRGALVVIGESLKSTTTLSKTVSEGGVGDEGGARGEKAIIRWFSPLENAGEGAYGSNEVGCVEKSNFTLSGDKLLLQGASYTALKNAFDAVAKTENGNAVEVYEVEYVTRNI